MELFRHSAGPLSKRLPAPRLHRSPQQHVDRERETEAERDVPMAEMMVTMRSLPSPNAPEISLPMSVSGTLTSSFGVPSLSMRFMKSCFPSAGETTNSCLEATHILDVKEQVFGALDVRDVHVVGLGRSSIHTLMEMGGMIDARTGRYPQASCR